ncbi:hypothetical protein [Lactobacillus crispatus]|uniref:Uncharacterized protein n=1 Tax=Lactobacillus crispatus TaxID=47770 RepID=A0A6A1Z8U9_9LACO|nr:hypothetical protein [Lactobacillus crispatus]KAB1978296.1 hypothetical protein F8251_00950 [Lactobacillus crispatus]MCT3537733.1 hypothetical protein [Lactobacillus crispatus]
MALVLKNICPYCGTETVKLLLLDEATNYVAQAYVEDAINTAIAIDMVVPNIDYDAPSIHYHKEIKVNYCPMCGRRLAND